jgi:cellulose synthase/poly-beta-1,6-N-acetylglucosamine synthase-like glycosyltransferase
VTGDLTADALRVVSWAVLFYFLAVNTSYAILIALAAGEFRRYRRLSPVADYEDDLSSPFIPSVSIVVPAYNEELTIVDSVKAMLSLRYPDFEVIVVVDGATDGTFAALEKAFDLVKAPRVVPSDVQVQRTIDAVYTPRTEGFLTVACKSNSGRADTLNCGVNLARRPLVCFVDADSVLDAEALLRVARPFVVDPDNVVATGGVIRAVNGCQVVHGRVAEVRMPSKWIPRIQVVEYLRAFLLGRTGWSQLRSLLVISGAFGLFRRDVVVECGGFDASCIGEDAELVCHIHGLMRDQRRPYRVVFVPEPVSWTEVPPTASVLRRQRRRWSRGLAEVLWRHRRMMFNPRYGRIGMIALPYQLVFELLAPFVQLVGLAFVIIGLALGAVNLSFGALFICVAAGYGLLLSLAALLIEEFCFHRYENWNDLAVALGAAVLENVGYRQMTAVAGLLGVWDAVGRRGQVWGEMSRQGFRADDKTPPPAPVVASAAMVARVAERPR